MKKYKVIVSVLMVLLINNTVIKAEEQKGGLFLSFDDRGINSWYNARYLFIKYDAKVTFFVSHFDYLSSEEIKKLQILKRDGHEVASHSLKHLDIYGDITGGDYNNHLSEIPRYLKEEIYPSIKLMTESELTPSSFAVPFNRRNYDYIDALQKEFLFVRIGTGFWGGLTILTQKEMYFTCQDHLDQRQLLHALPIDGQPASLLIDGLNKAYNQNEVIMFSAHSIINESDESESRAITLNKLETVLKTAREIGLKFYRVSDLRYHCLEEE